MPSPQMPNPVIRAIDHRENRPRRISVRRLATLSMVIATGMMLSGCADSFLDRTASGDTMSERNWDGPMKPRTSRTTFVRNGSQPLLPPVPEESNGLAPVKVSSLID